MMGDLPLKIKKLHSTLGMVVRDWGTIVERLDGI